MYVDKLNKKVIAIDGPAGAGKSTIAKLVAQKLGFLYIDTGAMFRVVAWKLKKHKISLSDFEKIKIILKDTTIAFKNFKEQLLVLCDGKDVSLEIRKIEISKLVSEVAAISEVRTFLLQEQRKIALDNDVVMDGRDIGTVVFPKADLKIFLEALPEVRAKRRFLELQKSKLTISEKELLEQINSRDKMDKERKIAPLKKADDAIEIDTSTRTIEEVVFEIIKLYNN